MAPERVALVGLHSSKSPSAEKAMEQFLSSGRVKAIGVSNFDPEDLDSLLQACETKPMVNQIRWFIGLDPSDTVQKCAEHDIVIEAYSPFAHGLIVNHPEIGDIAGRYGVSAPQLCIRYLLQKGTVVLPKATKTPHTKQNAELDFEISPADMDVLDAMRDTEKHEDALEFRWKRPIARLVPALSHVESARAAQRGGQAPGSRAEAEAQFCR